MVLRAIVVGGAPGGVYRAMPSGPCTQRPPPLANVVTVGMPATPVNTLLGFGVPTAAAGARDERPRVRNDVI